MLVKLSVVIGGWAGKTLEVRPAIVLAMFLLAGCAAGRPVAYFDAHVDKVSVSTGGRLLIDLTVRNKGPDASFAFCDVTAYNAKGRIVGIDGTTTTGIEPGQTRRTSFLSTLRPKKSFAHWDAACTVEGG